MKQFTTEQLEEIKEFIATGFLVTTGTPGPYLNVKIITDSLTVYKCIYDPTLGFVVQDRIDAYTFNNNEMILAWKYLKQN